MTNSEIRDNSDDLQGQIIPNNTPAIQADRILDALTALYPDASGHVADLMEYALCDLRHLADQHVIINAPVPEVLAFEHPFIRHFFLGERGQRAMQLLRARRHGEQGQ